MKEEIKAGIYRSRISDLPGRVHVRDVTETHVYFTRPQLQGMSISTIESFRGIVVIEEED